MSDMYFLLHEHVGLVSSVHFTSVCIPEFPGAPLLCRVVCACEISLQALLVLRDAEALLTLETIPLFVAS